MTDGITASTVFTLFQLCLNKLDQAEKIKLLACLNIANLGTSAVAFYEHVSTLDVNVNHSENMAVRKAVKSKIVSWYRREYNKMHPTVSVETNYTSMYKAKEIHGSTQRVDKKLVVKNDPMENIDWNFGITKFCMKLVSVGLASFGTFAAYFFYHEPGNTAQRYVVKLMADKENGGKKIVFVRN